MGSERQTYALTDLYSVSSGLSKPAKDFGEGDPFVSFKDVFYNFFLPDGLSQLVKSTEKEQEKCSVRRGDVFLTRTSETMEDLGMSCVARKDYPKATFNGFCKRLRPSTELPIHPEYVGYYLRTPQFRNEMLAFSTMSTRASLNNDMIGRLHIQLPPLPEQKAIAHILGTLDDKIELNRRMNATLEAMAQALFKSWFVDFDPVIDNALIVGNPIPDEFAARAEVRRQALANGTANREAAKLFPAAFQFSEEMGWIPDGWKKGKITDLADFNSESWNNKTHPDHVNYVDLANTKNGRINEVFPYDYSEAPSRARRVLKVDDTIIGTVRPGNRSFAYIHEGGLTGSTGFAVLRPKLEVYRSYVYLCLTQDDVIDHFAHLADGGAYPAIRPEVVGNLETVTFPQKLMSLFDQKSYPLIEKIGQNQRATDTLTNLRDTLLPKLISGELRILEAEQHIKETSA